MSFDVPAESYGRFMGRYSEPLASRFLSSLPLNLLPGGHPAPTALDVGCGPGAVTARLAERFGPAAVAAIDPSEPFVLAASERLPGVDVRLASVEDLPFPDDTFSLTLAALVVHFMPDPVRGLVEMARVTRPGGLLAATTWDFGGRRDPLATYRQASRDLGLPRADESALPGARAGDLARLFTAAGLEQLRSYELTVSVQLESFEQWWQPLTLGVGPAGAQVAGFDAATRERLRLRCEQLLPDRPITVTATAWACTGRT